MTPSDKEVDAAHVTWDANKHMMTHARLRSALAAAYGVREKASNKVIDGLQEALITSRVAHTIQSYHCTQTAKPAPCSDDCSCWDSTWPIIRSYLRALDDIAAAPPQEHGDG